MKHLANALTVLRIIAVFLLLFVYNDPYWFAAVYLFAGLTDVLDGFAARATNSESKLGARLDSAADFILYAFIVFFFISRMGGEMKGVILWIAAVAVIRAINIIISALKYHEIAFLHTWANKLTGFLLYLWPLIYTFMGSKEYTPVVISVAAFASFEEGVIHLLSDKPDLNRRSVFLKR